MSLKDETREVQVAKEISWKALMPHEEHNLDSIMIGG